MKNDESKTGEITLHCIVPELYRLPATYIPELLSFKILINSPRHHYCVYWTHYNGIRKNRN